MVDWSLVFAAVSSIVAVVLLLERFVSKRNEMRTWMRNFQTRTIESLNQKNTSRRGIPFMLIGAFTVGAGFEYYVGSQVVYYIVGVAFLGWILVGVLVFGNPEPEEEPIDDKVKRLLAEELKRRENPC
jgi:hypothetical protein